MSKLTLLILAFLVIVVTAIATLLINSSTTKTTSRNEIDQAANQAKFLYQQKKARGEDISNGPCLSNALMPGWAADLVHNPRQSIDDLSENQCPAYEEGRAQHFVELDLEGKLVRAK